MDDIKERLRQKLEKLYAYYKELEEYGCISREEYLQNTMQRRAIERVMQLMVEAATDINNMLLKMHDKTGAVDYFNSFVDIAEEGIIPLAFALQIAPSTGLRNIIVHEYEKIDDEIVYNSISSFLRYYGEYIKYINDYLNR